MNRVGLVLAEASLTQTGFLSCSKVSAMTDFDFRQSEDPGIPRC
jgi:hypothetical protein